MALGGGVDRPQVPAAERRLLHGKHQDLHEAPILGAALDLVDSIFGVLRRDDDRGAQPRIAVEPFLGDPVVERAGEGRGHVLAEQEAYAVEAVQDRQSRLPAVADLGGEFGRRHGGPPVLAAPFRPRRQRRVGRIGDGFERIDAALLHRLAPKVVEESNCLHVGHGRMHVAIDGVEIICVAQSVLLASRRCRPTSDLTMQQRWVRPASSPQVPRRGVGSGREIQAGDDRTNFARAV